MRLASAHEIDRVQFTVSPIQPPAKFSARERRWICFLAALWRLGYRGYHGWFGALVDAEYRAQGQTRSQGTARAALDQLEARGWIRRSRSRQRGIRLTFEISFENWLKTQFLRRLEKTKDPDPRSEPRSSVDPTIVSIEAARARAKRRQERTVHSIEPVVYTLRVVLGRRADRDRILAAAARAQIWLEPEWSGERWRERTHKERETEAISAIIPYLEAIAEQSDSESLRARPAASRRPVHTGNRAAAGEAMDRPGPPDSDLADEGDLEQVTPEILDEIRSFLARPFGAADDHRRSDRGLDANSDPSRM